MIRDLKQKLSMKYHASDIPLIQNDHFDSEEQSIKQSSKKINDENKYLDLYNIYLKILLGRHLNYDEQNKFGNGKVIDQKILPQAILSFPNPDHNAFSKEPPISALNAVEFITKVVSGKSDFEKQLLIKAAEQIYSKLDEERPKQSSKASFKHQFLSSQEDQSFSPRPNTIRTIGDILAELNDEFKDLIKKPKKLKIQEQLNIDFSKYEKQKPRKMVGGKFYDDKFCRTGKDTADYMTLIRNLIMLVLSKQGFSCNSFFSSDGKFIFCVLRAFEENLKTIAQLNMIKKEVNICFCDLLSFEPVDLNNRPLRLNNRLWKPKEFQLTPMFEYLRPKIIELIEQINFKKVAREVNQSGFNQTMFQYGKVDFNDDEVGLTDSEWVAFYQYLVHLEKHVSQYRIDQKIISDLSTLLNQQIDPITLYLKRNKNRDEIFHLNKQNIYHEENASFLEEMEQYQQQCKLLQDSYNSIVMQGIPTVKMIKILKQEELALRYLSIFKEALKIANAQEFLLFSIWDRLQARPMEPFIKYEKPDGGSIRLRSKQINFWRKYQITEDHQISMFASSEQLKLVYLCLNDTFLLNDLITKKLINQVFCLHDHYELFGHCLDFDKVMTTDNDYYRKKIFLLQQDWKFKFQAPWQIPCDLITEYYGQKIGLYFYYLSYFTMMLAPIGVVGIVCSILQWLIWENDDPRYILITLFFSSFQIQWTSILDEYWDQKQQLFNLKQGQSHKDTVTSVRSKFEGQYVRSTENDQLNATQQDSKIYRNKCLFSALIMVIISLIYGGLMVGLFMITIDLKEKYGKELDSVQVMSLAVTVTASINIILIHIFDAFYDKICEGLTDNENPQTVQDYENSFVLKKYILEFVSYMAPLFFIAYLNSPIAVYCYDNNCLLHSQYHFSTMVIWLFAFRTIKYIKFIYNLLKIPIFKYDMTQKSQREYIEEQSKRQQFAISQERYGTLEDYMGIYIYNTLLSMFGYSFPISFFFVFLQSLAQLFADRTKFLYLLQRPWPQTESSLGIWRTILRFISYLSLLNNSGSASLAYARRYDSSVAIVFGGIVMLNASAKFVLGSIFSTTPDIVDIIIRRQKYIIKVTYEQFKKNTTLNSSSKNQNMKRYPIFKVYRTVLLSALQRMLNKFESISSQSDLDDHYVVSHENEQESARLRELKKKDTLVDAIAQIQLRKKPSSQNNTDSKLQIKQSQIFNLSKKYPNLDKKQSTPSKSNSVIEKQKRDKELEKEQEKLKEKLEKQKENIVNLDEISLEKLKSHFMKRCSNWAFKFQIMCQNYKLKNSIEKKHLKFLYQIQRLAPYRKIWMELRFTQRAFYMKRSNQLIRNLDWRKVIILKQNYEQMQVMYTDKAEDKFRKRITYLESSQREDDIQEHRNLLIKYNNYIEKHKWVQMRKVVTIKSKAIWFNGFRKQIQKQPSLKTVKDFYRTSIIMDKIKEESPVHNEFEQLVDYKIIHLYDLDQFMRLFSQLKMIQKDYFHIPLDTRPINPMIFHSAKLRSQDYKYICDTFRETFIFDIQTTKLQEIGFQYFCEELFQMKKYKFIKTHPNQIWTAQDDQQRYKLLQFIQIKYEDQLVEFKKSTQHFGVYYAQAEQFYQKASIVDYVDDFNSKGYVINSYDLMSFYNLAYMIKYRNFYSLPYSLQKLLQFLKANLVIIAERKHGDISIDNYYLNGQSYVLLQPRNNLPDLYQLAKVILEMIKLSPVENFKEELHTLEHPLKGVLKEMLNPNADINKLTQLIKEEGVFEELFIDQEFQPLKQEKQIINDYVLENIHKLNLFLRMRQYSEFSIQFNSFEQHLAQNVFESKEIPIKSFCLYLKEKFSHYVLNATNLKLVSQIIIAFYMKMAILVQQRLQFSLDAELLIEQITIIKTEIDLLLRELSLNLRTDDLTDMERDIIIKKKQQVTKVNLSENQRILLLNNLRKHQSYAIKLFQYRRKFQRYINQFQALLAINDYYQSNFTFATIKMEEILKNQVILIINEKLPAISQDPDEISPSYFNFNQQSPTDQIWQYEIQKTNNQFYIKEQYQLESPNYVNQFIAFEYIRLIMLFDSKDELFQQKIQQFRKRELKSQQFNLYLQQLLVLIKEDIDQQFLNNLNNCLIGQIIYLDIQKWLESYQRPTVLRDINNKYLQYKYIMGITYLDQSYHNWCKLQELYLNLKEQMNQVDILMKIRLLHQRLHMEQYYYPVLAYQNYEISNLQQDFKSLFLQLDELHNQFKISKKSWFFKEPLIQLYNYHLLSICFIYSPKQIYNIGKEQKQLLKIALEQIEQNSLRDDLQYQIIKKNIILQEVNNHINVNDNDKLADRLWNLNGFLYTLYLREGNLENLYQQISASLRVEGFKSSLFIIQLIQFYLSIQQYEFADIMIEFSRKLLYHQAPCFQNAHFGFQDDLNYLDLIKSLRVVYEVKPYDQLYKRLDLYLVSNDSMIYIQTLLLNSFYTIQYEATYDAFKNFLILGYDKLSMELKKNQKIIDISNTLMMLMLACAGNDFSEQIREIKDYKYKEGTLIRMLVNHLLCRFYINQLDFEIAIEYSKKVLDYIYSVDFNSEVIVRQQTIINNYWHYQHIYTPQLINIVHETDDFFFIHLFDEYLRKESILNHLDILTKLRLELPPVQILFHLIKNTKQKLQQVYLLRIISQYFQIFGNEEGVAQLKRDLQSDFQKKTRKLNKERAKIKQQQINKILLKRVTRADIILYDNNLSLIEFQLSIYIQANGELDIKNILNWSVYAADKAQKQMLQLLKHLKVKSHQDLCYINILISQNLQQLNFIQASVDKMNEANDIISQVFEGKKHPISGYHYFVMAQLKRWINHAYLQCAQDAKSLLIFSKPELRFLLSKLLMEDQYITWIFDEYRGFRDREQFAKNLQKYLENGNEEEFIDKQIFDGDGMDIINDIRNQQANSLEYGLQDYFMRAYQVFGYFNQNHQYMQSVQEELNAMMKLV